MCKLIIDLYESHAGLFYLFMFLKLTFKVYGLLKNHAIVTAQFACPITKMSKYMFCIDLSVVLFDLGFRRFYGQRNSRIS